MLCHVNQRQVLNRHRKHINWPKRSLSGRILGSHSIAKKWINGAIICWMPMHVSLKYMKNDWVAPINLPSTLRCLELINGVETMSHVPFGLAKARNGCQMTDMSRAEQLRSLRRI